MNSFICKTEQAFDVIGIAARTTNAAEFQGRGIILRLWQRFIQDRIASKIPNRLDSDILALYYDYASDKDGEYSFLIGARVKAGTEVPEGMVVVRVPASGYAVFTTQKGAVPKVVIDVWQKIWQLEESGELKRAYRIDYQQYDERSYNPLDAKIDIYISVRD